MSRKLFKIVLLTVLCALIIHGAFAQGVQHAIETACPYVDGEYILIDFDGQVHEYR